MDSINEEVIHDMFPYLKVYKNGTIERIAGTETVPAGYDPRTGVTSKDILINPKTGISARLYRPNLTSGEKLPFVVYFHGGAFMIATAEEPRYHDFVNRLVADAKIIAVSVSYRLAPEFPLPIAYDDSYEVLQWLNLQSIGEEEEEEDDYEPWLKEHVDFARVYMAGDSAGANIAHHSAIRFNDLGSNPTRNLKIHGIILINPYFWGADPIGSEQTDSFRKALVDKWWLFVCPSEKGNDDPFIDPFVNGAPSLSNLGCDRVLVTVSEKDILRDRGVMYYEALAKTRCEGTVEILEIDGEDHVFHIFDPDCDKAKYLIKRLASFINNEV